MITVFELRSYGLVRTDRFFEITDNMISGLEENEIQMYVVNEQYNIEDEVDLDYLENFLMDFLALAIMPLNVHLQKYMKPLTIVFSQFGAPLISEALNDLNKSTLPKKQQHGKEESLGIKVVMI